MGELGYKHYGRYVDDFYIVVREEELEKVKYDVRVIDAFLNGIGLSLNKKKTCFFPAWQGVPFLGMVVKAHAILPGRRISRNFMDAAYKFAAGYSGSVESVISYLGMLSNYQSGHKVDEIFAKVGWERNW